MSNIDQQEIKEAWVAVTSGLNISRDRLIRDIANITEIWDSTTERMDDDLHGCMNRLASFVVGYIIGTDNSDKLTEDCGLPADLLVLIIDFVLSTIEHGTSELVGLRKYDGVDATTMLDAITHKNN